MADTDQGRGIVCFDFDRDGDIDIFVANNAQEPSLYRNDGGNSLNFYSLRLRTPGPNKFAVHARVTLTAGGITQIREAGGTNNYLSNNPPGEVHFGLGAAETIDELTIRWPDGELTTLHGLPANQTLTLTQGETPGLDVLALPTRIGRTTSAGGLQGGDVRHGVSQGLAVEKKP